MLTQLQVRTKWAFLQLLLKWDHPIQCASTPWGATEHSSSPMDSIRIC